MTQEEIEKLTYDVLELFKEDESLLYEEIIGDKSKFSYEQKQFIIRELWKLKNLILPYHEGEKREIYKIKITDKGKKCFQEIVVKKFKQILHEHTEIEQRIFINRVHISTVQTNESIQKLNKKTIRIYSFQKITTILTVLVAIFALRIGCEQLKNDKTRMIMDAHKDSLERNTQLSIDKIDRQIRSINLSLDSMRGPPRPDTALGK